MYLNNDHLFLFLFYVGDGNIHVNLTSTKFDDKILNALEPYIYEEVSKFSGSISAEHGVGLMKAKYLQYSKTENEINFMKLLKCQIDPYHILNPYKIIQ